MSDKTVLMAQLAQAKLEIKKLQENFLKMDRRVKSLETKGKKTDRRMKTSLFTTVGNISKTT